MFKSSAIVGVASLLLPKSGQNVTVTQNGQGGSQTGGSILGTTLYDTIKQIADRNKTIGATGTVEVGEPFTLMLTRDVEMEAYRSAK